MSDFDPLSSVTEEFNGPAPPVTFVHGQFIAGVPPSGARTALFDDFRWRLAVR